MTLVTAALTMSVDGFLAGKGQRLDAPFGDGVEPGVLHRWAFEEAEANAAEIAFVGGKDAYVMGRHMFTPGRGEWDLTWTGWWGAEPPYAAPVFVLTHFPRESLTMGATTFHFVTDGFDAALARAVDVAGPDGTVGISGGAATVRQGLAAGAIDELQLSVSPVVIGAGEGIFTDLGGLGLELVSTRGTALVSHLRYRPTGGRA